MRWSNTPGGSINHLVSPCFRAFSQPIGVLLANIVSPSRLRKVTHEINPNPFYVLIRCRAIQCPRCSGSPPDLSSVCACDPSSGKQPPNAVAKVFDDAYGTGVLIETSPNANREINRSHGSPSVHFLACASETSSCVYRDGRGVLLISWQNLNPSSPQHRLVETKLARSKLGVQDKFTPINFSSFVYDA